MPPLPPMHGLAGMVQPPLPPGKPPGSPGKLPSRLSSSSPPLPVGGGQSGQSGSGGSSSWANVLKGKQEAERAQAQGLARGLHAGIESQLPSSLSLTGAPADLMDTHGAFGANALDGSVDIDADPYFNDMLNDLMGTPSGKWDQSEWTEAEQQSSRMGGWPSNPTSMGLDSEIYKQLFQGFPSGQPGPFNAGVQ